MITENLLKAHMGRCFGNDDTWEKYSEALRKEWTAYGSKTMDWLLDHLLTARTESVENIDGFCKAVVLFDLFQWASTPQGHDYWYEACQRFANYCKDNNVNF